MRMDYSLSQSRSGVPANRRTLNYFRVTPPATILCASSGFGFASILCMTRRRAIDPDICTVQPEAVASLQSTTMTFVALSHAWRIRAEYRAEYAEYKDKPMKTKLKLPRNAVDSTIAGIRAASSPKEQAPLLA
jgi:hypothetical protein